MQQLCEDTGCSPEDLLGKVAIGKSGERVSGISVIAARHDDDVNGIVDLVVMSVEDYHYFRFYFKLFRYPEMEHHH